jgi:phosphoglycolate phosphatase-like HAD superfamily hydrolase
MTPTKSILSRRAVLSAAATLPVLSGAVISNSRIARADDLPKRGDPLPSWNEGATKQAIVNFVRATTDQSGPDYVPPPERVSTFDQDGTLWVEHPLYSQLVYSLERIPAIVNEKPELKDVEPFKTVLSGDFEAIAKFTLPDFEKIIAATMSGMTTEEFNAEARAWINTARDRRWKRPYTELIYQPMVELMRYLRNNGYKTYIVTGGGEDFLRAYADDVYGIPPEQIIGSAGGLKYSYAKDGKPIMTKEPKLWFDDNNAGKAESIYRTIGRRPYAAFGNTSGDQEMLEWTGAGGGTRLKMLVMHDDGVREYAYGPANGLPDTKVGAFSQELFDEAKKNNWNVISMKNDWKRIFAFD